jgi:hypothetical protein
MNKVLIINKANINYSGAKVRNLNLAIELSKRNKKVFLLTINELKIYINGKRVFQKKINLLDFFIIFFRRYQFWLCDIIIFSIFLKKNLFFTIHDIKEWMDYNRGGLLKKILIYIIVKKSKFCITLSKKLSIFLSKKYNKKFYIIKNGLSPQWLQTPKKIKIIEKYLIYVSNFMAHKNHLSLIKLQKNLNYKIFLVGRPIDKKGLEIYNSLKNNKNFKIVSNPSNSKLQSLVKYSQFVLFPSKLEGFGIPIIESLSQGKSILIEGDLRKQLPFFSKCKKIFFHDFSKKFNVNDVKKILTRKSCKNCIYKDFDWQKITDDFEKIIEKI